MNNTSKLRRTGAQVLLHYSIWLIFFLIVLVTSVFAPSFLNGANVVSMLREAVVVGVLAIGMSFVIISGCFDLSAGALMGLCCVVSMRIVPSNGIRTVLALVVPILIGVVFGLIDGFLVGFLHLNGFIATLGMQYALLGITLLYTNGSYTILTDYSGFYYAIGNGTLFGIPLQIVLMFCLALAAQWVLSRTNLGQNILASGANDKAATLSGVRVAKMRCISYVVLGVCASLAGIILASWVRQFEPSTGIGYEFEAITAVILGGASLSGGRGNIFNSVAGAFIMVMVVNAMILLNISYNFQLMVRGLILIIAVTVQVLTRGKHE